MNKYTKKDMIQALREQTIEMGYVPKKHEFKHRGVATTLFGDYANLVRAAGYSPIVKKSDFELLIQLKAFMNQYDETLCFDKTRELAPFDTSIYIARFGSWNKALKAAGIKPCLEIGVPELSKEAFLKEYIEKVNEFKSCLTIKEINVLFKGRYNANMIRTAFGGMYQLQLLAQDDPRCKVKLKIRKPNYKYNAEQINNIFRDYKKQYPDYALHTKRFFQEQLKTFGISLEVCYTHLQITSFNVLKDYMEGL